MDFQKAVELINKSGNVLVTTHNKPDGDACGCVAAVVDVLTALGKKAGAVLLSELPEWYGFLFAGSTGSLRDEKPTVLGKHITLQQLKKKKFDLIILVDVNSNGQLEGLEDFLKEAEVPIVAIDHHETGDGLGDVELIDKTAAATGIIVHEFFKYAGWEITKKIAEALFVAIASDTGWFQFRNTDSRVYRICAELIGAGADPTQIHHNLYHQFSLERFVLMTAMLNTLELHFDGRFAVQHLTQADFKRTGAKLGDTENLIDECRRIGTVEAAALFVELADGRIKCSLRSSGGVDVCRIAEKFGGGGHKMAAGTHLLGPLEDAKRLILCEVQKQLPYPPTAD